MTYIKKLDDFINEAIHPLAPWLDGKDNEEKNHRKYAHEAMTAAKRKDDLKRIKVFFDHNGKINPSDFGGIHDVLKDINWYIGAMYEPIKDHIKTNPDLGEKFFNMAVNIDRIYGGGKVQDAAICSFHKKIVQDKLYMFEPWNKGKSEIAQVFRMYLNFIEDKYSIVAESRSYRRGRRINEMIVNDGTMFTPKTEVELVGIIKNLYPERGLDGDYSDIDISGIRDAGIVKDITKNGKIDEPAIALLYFLGCTSEKEVNDIFKSVSFCFGKESYKHIKDSKYEIKATVECQLSHNDDWDVFYIDADGTADFWDCYDYEDKEVELHRDMKNFKVSLGWKNGGWYPVEKFPIGSIIGEYMYNTFNEWASNNDNDNDIIMGCSDLVNPPRRDDEWDY